MEDKYKKPIEMFVDRAFKKYSGIIDEIILFGSVATGHAKNDSDIDILVITDGDDFIPKNDVVS
jgi:predicted nucleotidyltransferase